RVEWFVHIPIAERDPLTQNAIIPDFRIAMNHNTARMFKYHSLSQFYAVGQFNPVHVAHMAEQHSIYHAERRAEHFWLDAHAPHPESVSGDGAPAGFCP